MVAVLKRINYICFLIKCFLKLSEVELFTLLLSPCGVPSIFTGVSTVLSINVMVSGRDS